MAHAMTLGLPAVYRRLEERDGKVAIVGTGPSLSGFVDVLREWKGEVWAINGALDWLQLNGREADACVLCDALPELARFLKNPPKKTRYYVASVCHADVFEALKDRNVIVWHLAQHEAMPPSGTYTIGGGPTALTRAPTLAWCQGIREIHMFGGDSSFTDVMYVEGAKDARQRDGLPADCIQVKVGDRVFLTHPPLVGQATYMATLADALPAKIEFHGDGLGPVFARMRAA